MIRTLISCALALGITASCSETGNSESSVAGKAVTALGLQSDRAKSQDIRFVQQVQAGAPQMKFGIEELEIVTVAVPDTVRDGIETWLVIGGMSFALQDGFLRSTRGLGDDLMTAELAQTRALVLGLTEGKSTRTMAYLGAEDAIENRLFNCDVTKRGARDLAVDGATVRTTLMAEDCRGPTGMFGNLYWVKNSTGTIVQSRQWGSDRIGPIVMRAAPDQ